MNRNSLSYVSFSRHKDRQLPRSATVIRFRNFEKFALSSKLVSWLFVMQIQLKFIKWTNSGRKRWYCPLSIVSVSYSVIESADSSPTMHENFEKFEMISTPTGSWIRSRRRRDRIQLPVGRRNHLEFFKIVPSQTWRTVVRTPPKSFRRDRIQLPVGVEIISNFSKFSCIRGLELNSHSAEGAIESNCPWFDIFVKFLSKVSWRSEEPPATPFGSLGWQKSRNLPTIIHSSCSPGGVNNWCLVRPMYAW